MNKACPVVLRADKENAELLVFRHPSAGMQVVKGSIEQGESLGRACERELFEESGLHGKSSRFLGVWESGYKRQVWGFCLMELTEPPKDCWSHFTSDGGGLMFCFSWQNIISELTEDFHPLFQGAIRFIQEQL